MVEFTEKTRRIPYWQIFCSWFVEHFSYLLLVGLCLPTLLWQLDVYPAFWFDEGYKANAAQTLAERGVYGTYTVAGYVPFDPGISSGPVDIIFTALSFKLLGIGIVQARLVAVLFVLMALFSMYAITVDIYGRQAGLFVILIVWAMPAIQGISFVQLGRQSLGEGPALGLITFGLWLWFRHWDKGRWLPLSFAGAVMGLGLLSKTQIGLALLPALGLITLGRGRKNWALGLQTGLPLVIVLAILVSWSLVGDVATSESVRLENSLMLREAIASNILTGLWGQTLTPSAWTIIALMSIAVISGGWRLIRISANTAYEANKWWIEATLTLFVLFYIVWFSLFSVGWPRYAFAGLIAALLLLGKTAWDIFQLVSPRTKQHWSGFSPFFYPLAVFSLSFAGLWTNLYPIVTFSEATQAQKTADYIRREIPRDAVIESWAWELDALSGHWEYHHPHQRYLFEAIREYSHYQQRFDLNYNLLEADPDYLITSPFSNWTGIYPDTSLKQNFIELTRIGAYRIYQRSR